MKEHLEGRVQIKAIVFGVLTYLAVAIGVGVLAVLALNFQLVTDIARVISLSGPTAPPTLLQQQEARLQAALGATPTLIMNAVVGTLALVAGGYVAAHHARGAKIKNALALGSGFAVLNALALALLIVSPDARRTTPLWTQLVAMLVAVPATFIGGSLRAAARENDAPPSELS